MRLIHRLIAAAAGLLLPDVPSLLLPSRMGAGRFGYLSHGPSVRQHQRAAAKRRRRIAHRRACRG